VGAKVKKIDGYKLWYSGFNKATNRVGILVKKDFLERAVEVRRKSDRIMSVKLVVDSDIFNIFSIYAPQIGLEKDIKRFF